MLEPCSVPYTRPAPQLTRALLLCVLRSACSGRRNVQWPRVAEQAATGACGQARTRRCAPRRRMMSIVLEDRVTGAQRTQAGVASGCKLGKLLLLGRWGNRRGISRILDLRLKLQGGSHRRYSNRPIATVEACVRRLGVLAGGLGRLFGHSWLHGTRRCLIAGMLLDRHPPTIVGMASECGRNAQGIVPYRDISTRVPEGRAQTHPRVKAPLRPAREHCGGNSRHWMPCREQGLKTATFSQQFGRTIERSMASPFNYRIVLANGDSETSPRSVSGHAGKTCKKRS
jgi:hypothetical protein